MDFADKFATCHHYWINQKLIALFAIKKALNYFNLVHFSFKFLLKFK